MVARVDTVAFEGVAARPVEVQAQIASGAVAFTSLGLGDNAVRNEQRQCERASRTIRFSARGPALGIEYTRAHAVLRCGEITLSRGAFRAT